MKWLCVCLRLSSSLEAELVLSSAAGGSSGSLSDSPDRMSST